MFTFVTDDDAAAGAGRAGSGVWLGFEDPTNSVMNPPDTNGFTTTGLRFAGIEDLGVTEAAGQTSSKMFVVAREPAIDRSDPDFGK
jgi:hypothetical protein